MIQIVTDMLCGADVLEDYISELSPDLLNALLKDHTTSKDGNQLMARESMLVSFIEYYQQKFGKQPLLKSINYIAYIISWNVWQMDGLKGVVPGSCHKEKAPENREHQRFGA